MSDINRVGEFLRAIPVDYLSPRASGRFRAERSTALADAPVDGLEVSDLGTALSRMSEAPAVRVSRIAKIRAAIAADTYETANKIDATVERLLGELSR